jgi:uncharacterized repeat protein (TIGR03806 family)
MRLLLTLLSLALLPAGLRGQSLEELAAPKPLDYAELPEGFSELVVARGLTGATALAVAPDGRVFVCEQTGALRVVKDDKLLPAPFVTLKVDSYWERGLIGVALDPGFPKRPYVYLCYIATDPYPHHRVSRFTAKGDVAVPGSEVVLLRGDDQRKLGGAIPAGHQGGAVHFGKDGKLYVAIGEQTAGDPAQRLDTFQGKLLRIGPDGSIPPDNPFYMTAKGKYRAIWARGLRNPFAFAVHPRTGRIFINDVGGSRWEEVNEGKPGANYGWPLTEGPTTDPRFKSPLHAYDRNVGRSITGGAFYAPAVSQFPRRYAGKYFFCDFIDNWVRVLDPDSPRHVEVFATGLRGPVDLGVASDGSLYLLERNAWVKDGKFRPNTGSLHRIRYTPRSGHPAPLITEHPSGALVAPGQRPTLRVRAKGKAPLAYQWQKDGVAIPGATKPELTLPPARPGAGARYRCVVTNAHGGTKSRPAAVRVATLRRPDEAGKCLPGRVIAAPPVEEGESVTLQGFLQAPADGVYTFTLQASGVAKLFVGEARVADTHGPGAIGLRKGKHLFKVLFTHAKGKPHLALRWSGPGLEAGPVPRGALWRPDPASPLAPVITPAGGIYTGPVRVRLASLTPGASIRYTTDGTSPTSSSTLYEGPFTLSRSGVVRALAFAGGRPSPASRVAFTVTGSAPYGLAWRETPLALNVPRDPEALPARLSQTGIFRSLADLTPNRGLVPYEVNSPLWSDGAAKKRWLALPGEGRIGFTARGAWRFPAGTVLVKHFGLGKRLETRLLVVGEDGLGYGATYKWRADGKDADLLRDALTEALPGKKNWYYPSRGDCLVCHTRAAGFVLGVNARQLNGPFTYPGGVKDNQLRAWSHARLFDRAVPDRDLPRLPRLAALSDKSASLEQRVRSYLDANCAQCHRPGGSPGQFDARFEVPLARQKLLGGELVAADLGVSGARVVKPGDPEKSMLYLRMKRRRDVFNMPPLASNAVDEEALAVVGAWIRGLAPARGERRGLSPPGVPPR